MNKQQENLEYQNEYLKELGKFEAFKNSDIVDGERMVEVDDLHPLVKKIVMVLKAEKGLTYADAYAALECVYRFLKKESIFVQMYRE